MNKKEYINIIVEILKKNNCKRMLNQRAEKLLRRISTAKSNLTTRGKENGLTTDFSLNELRDLIINNIFKPDPYLPEYLINDKNFNIDHIVPISKNGKNEINNLQVLNKTVNKLKSNLSESDFKILIKNINQLPSNIKNHVIIKMTTNGKF